MSNPPASQPQDHCITPAACSSPTPCWPGGSQRRGGPRWWRKRAHIPLLPTGWLLRVTAHNNDNSRRLLSTYSMPGPRLSAQHPLSLSHLISFMFTTALRGRFYDLDVLDDESEAQNSWVAWLSSCHQEVAGLGWVPRSIIIKAGAYIIWTVCWAQWECFVELVSQY